ncbi:MAG TPA: hypothetical protein VMV23_02430 [Candidatus Nanopelagicaceae bacterium]|nr:hypothetical protein [Candidatus Nanopelagicaceae bacterium]
MADLPEPSQLPGARVASSWARPDPSLVARLARLPAAVIADSMHRTNAMAGEIRMLWPGAKLCGPALTVFVRSGDNFRLHEALGLARAGDVLVVNAQGSLGHAVFGELMATRAKALGVAGLVVDGAVRDIADLERMGFAVFGLGSCPGGPTKEGTGEIGQPIACGRVVVAAGDVVIGDHDGVVVVPRAACAQVLAAAEAALVLERQKRVAAEAGASFG